MKVIIKTANYFVSILRKSITDSISYLRFQDFPHHLWQTSMWYSSDTYLVLINISQRRPNITHLSLLIRSLFISPCEQDCVVTIKVYNLELSTSSEQTSFYPSAQDTSLFFHCFFFFFFLFFLFQEFHVIPLVRIVDTFVE